MHNGTVNQCGAMRRNNKFYFGKIITSVLGDACGQMDVPGRQLLQDLELRKVAKAGDKGLGVITM